MTRSIVPFIGLQTSPRMPFPRPLAPPLSPPARTPFTGSVITPATAENIFVSMDLVPIARPDATLEGWELFTDEAVALSVFFGKT